MKKEDLYRMIRPGAFIGIESKGLIPGAIKYFRGDSFNHSIIAKNMPYITESTEKGVHEDTLDKYIDNPDKHVRIIIREPLLWHKNPLMYSLYFEKMQEKIEKLEGKKKYDFWNLLFFQMIRYSYKKLTGGFLWLGGNEKTGKKRFVCEEYCQYLYNYSMGLFPEYWKLKGYPICKDKRFKTILEIKTKNITG